MLWMYPDDYALDSQLTSGTHMLTASESVISRHRRTNHSADVPPFVKKLEAWLYYTVSGARRKGPGFVMRL